MDKLTSARRSENMRRIRSKDTQPELLVRRLCRDLGYTGYRVHRKDLPGKPDLAWIGRKRALFVHGCFWHAHDCVEGTRKPKSNQGYWLPKIEGNRQRDTRNILHLSAMGWRVLVIWDCETKATAILIRRLRQFL